MRIALACIAVAVVALAAAPAAAQGSGLREAVFDLTRPVLVEDLSFVTGCGGGGFSSDAALGWFRYVEVDDPATPPNAPPGYFDTGCGTASWSAPVPEGTDHVHVRFTADRTVQFASGQMGQNASFVQQVRVSGGTGSQAFDYYNATEGPSGPRPFGLPAVALPEGAGQVDVAWYFEDTGVASLGPFSLFASGAAYSGRVEGASVEFSSVPAGAEASGERERSGAFLVERSVVAFDVPSTLLEGYAVDLRARLDPDLAFRHLEAPDGTRFGLTTTRSAEGPAGYDRGRVLLEQTGSFLQVTVSSDLVERFGPGEYRLVLEQVSGVRADARLLPVAAALLLLPVPFAAATFTRVRAFERVAFGGFRRSARRLRLAVVLAILYYLGVLVRAFVGGRLDLMASPPLRTEALMLYGEVLLAVLAFVALFSVAHELSALTRPPAPPEQTR